MKYNYPLYNFYAIKAAYIHISDICNFKCRICALPESRKKSCVPLKRAKENIRKAADLGLYNIIFTGQEVILHPDIDEIIRFAFDDCNVRYITFNTNGLGFSNRIVQDRLNSVKNYLDKIYIATSVNFVDADTFKSWSGCNKDLFKKWLLGIGWALEWNPKLLFDMILKDDIDIKNILSFLSNITKGKIHRFDLRILDLLPLGHTTSKLYRDLKPRLLKVAKIIPEIANTRKRILEFESFPICVYNQRHLKEEKYYFYNFHIYYENGLPIQYDPGIYETYFDGPTENWSIDKIKLRKAYDKMFVYIDECSGCYYRQQCYGVQREYIKIYGRKKTNKELKLLKRLNFV